MQKMESFPHHRKVFWIAAATAIVGLILLFAARLTALDTASSSGLSVAPGGYRTPLSEILGMVLLAAAAGFFAWAWHLMTKASGPQRPQRVR